MADHLTEMAAMIWLLGEIGITFARRNRVVLLSIRRMLVSFGTIESGDRIGSDTAVVVGSVCT
jgi:hypothetical protein